MHVVEIFLPLTRKDGSPQPRALFGELRRELVEKFGGLTAFTRAPAEGLWEKDEKAVEADSIVIFEVMAPELNPIWWAEYRERLERQLHQDEVLIRSSRIERL